MYNPGPLRLNKAELAGGCWNRSPLYTFFFTFVCVCIQHIYHPTTDEHIAPQIIQLGSFIFDENKTIMMKEGVLANTATLETKLIF